MTTALARGHRRALVTLVIASLVSTVIVLDANREARATSDDSPYTVPLAVDVNPDPDVLETTFVADEATVDVGGGLMANVYAYNGSIPGPEIRITPGQRVIVHLTNQLPDPTGIHWHGIELSNPHDGTPLTQNQVQPGETFTYDFVAPRPGVYWYHPHHEFSTNDVFKGLYGSIVIADPNEPALITAGRLPSAADTRTLVLSDITVCKASGSNDAATYDPSLPWAGGGPLPAQAAPHPTTLCDTPIDNHGDPLSGPLSAGDVPNIQLPSGRVNEGQTVLTNGMNVGGRAGTPASPGALDAAASTLAVQPGQGLRLQAVNAATTRFFRLLATDSTGAQLPLLRVGGEGGLLDDVVVDGTKPGDFDFKYDEGEILLDPGDRADVVIAFPATATGVATLWTQDFRRTGGGDSQGGWTNTPTVPVAHFELTGAPLALPFTLGAGDGLRSFTGDPVELLPAATGNLLDPATLPGTPPGSASEDITFTVTGGPGIDGNKGVHDFSVDYSELPHGDSSRYAMIGEVLELTVTNTSPAHHPFHLHGFSMQPLSLSGCTDGTDPLPVDGTTFVPEFVDELDVPGFCTYTFRVRLEDRPFPDGTPGGGLGRWVIHCHIFFHHHQGMETELVVLGPTVDITSPADGALYPLGSTVEVTADVFGGIAPTFDWDDGSATTVGTTTDDVVYTSSHAFAQAGVYTIVATIENGDYSVSDSVMVVVYDPSAGFVTGGGTIDSPPGAFVADPALSGTASFGFVSKYKRGASVPDGQTQFTFQAADLAFHSTAYEWLVIAGARAQYKGTGTINDAGNYGFLLTAVDGQTPGGGDVDKFRVKIWDIDDGDSVVYDNGLGASEDIDDANPQPLRSGSVVIHTGKS